MDVDDVYRKMGEFGSSQKRITYLICVYQIAIGFQVLMNAFIGVTPEWSCKEGLETGKDQCSSFEEGQCTPVYSPEFTSIVTEWNLVCSKSYQANFSQSVFFLGTLIGSWVFGTLADKIGRKKVLFISLFLAIFAALGYSLSPTYLIFVLFRFLAGVFIQGQILSSYVLTLELLGSSKRTVVGLSLTGMFAFAYPLLSLLAYSLTEWRMLSTVCAVVLLPFCALWWLVPESPRWLLVTGKENEAKAVLTKLARGNGREMPQGDLKTQSSTESSVSIVDLFKGKVIRFRTSVMFVAWFTNCLTYYALSLAAGDLGGDRYISFSLSGLVELPSIILAYYILGRFGRKWAHAGFLSSSGCACLLWTLLNMLGSGESLKMCVALTGKFAVAGSFSIVYLYAAEVFPTQVRNIAMGVVTIGARTGGILAPMVILLAQYNTGLPMFLVGVLAAATGVLSLSLPETLGQPMPETLAELEMAYS